MEAVEPATLELIQRVESIEARPILGFWNFRGVGQAVRCLLAYLDVDYIGRPYSSREDWYADRDSLGLDFPKLPYWIDGEVKLTEPRAILKHLARRYDPSLFPFPSPAPPELMWHADVVECVIRDAYFALVNLIPKSTDELVRDFEREQPLRMQRLSTYLGTKKWILDGDKISILDFALYEILIHQKWYNPGLLFDPFPNFSLFVSNFQNVPAIQKFLSSSISNNTLEAPVHS